MHGHLARKHAMRLLLPTLALLLHPACVGLLLLPFHPVLFLCLFAMLVMCACVCKKFSAWQVSKGPRRVVVRCEKKTRRREAIRRRRQASRQLRALRYENKTRSMRALMLLPFLSTWLFRYLMFRLVLFSLACLHVFMRCFAFSLCTVTWLTVAYGCLRLRRLSLRRCPFSMAWAALTSRFDNFPLVVAAWAADPVRSLLLLFL